MSGDDPGPSLQTTACDFGAPILNITPSNTFHAAGSPRDVLLCLGYGASLPRCVIPWSGIGVSEAYDGYVDSVNTVKVPMLNINSEMSAAAADGTTSPR